MALVAASTNTGVKKQQNQDACCIKVAKTSVGEVILAVVCDGVGGLSLGELASTTVANTFSKWFDQNCASYLKNNTKNGVVNLSNLQGVWKQLINKANAAIFSYGCKNQNNLGTTCSALLICQNSFFIAHVGDCRIYRISKDSYSLLTKDQTLVQQRLDNKIISKEQAANHPQKNMLLQAIGTKNQVCPEFYAGNCLAEDAFVLCCDGFYRSLDETYMINSFRGVLQSNNKAIKTVCDSLINDSLANGSLDNITVAFVQQYKSNMQWASSADNSNDSNVNVDKVKSSLDDDDDQATTVLDKKDNRDISVIDDGDDQVTTVLDQGDDEDEQTTALDSDKGPQNG